MRRELARFLCLAMTAALSMALSTSILTGPAHATDSIYPRTAAAMFASNEAFFKIDKANVMGESFNMHFLSTTKVNGTYYGYYVKPKPDGKFATGVATSTNGVNWTNHGIAVDNGPAGAVDDELASFPGVWYALGQWTLTYECAPDWAGNNAICLATSHDGINFSKWQGTGGPILTKGGGWESAGIGTPSLWFENSTWYLYYHAFDGVDCRLGFASGPSLDNLTKSANNPVLNTTAGAWDAGTVGKRSIRKEGSFYYMAYEGSTDQPYDTALWSTGLARAPSITGPWTKYSQNPVLPLTQWTFGNDGPEWIDVGGETWLYFRSVGALGSVTRRAKIANETNGGWGGMWESEGAGIFHNLGSAQGEGWETTPSQGAGYASFGPYTTATPVDWCNLVFKLRINSLAGANDVVARIEVRDQTDNVVITWRDIRRADFKQANHYEFFIVPFRVLPSWDHHQLEFRTYVTGAATIRQDRVGFD
jgi:hypothetical protein